MSDLYQREILRKVRQQTASGIRAFNFHGALNFGLCDILEDHVAPEILANVLQKSRQPRADDDHNPALTAARSASG